MKGIDLGQAITILANIGVIAGIIFLALELRQNTAAVRLNAAQYLASEQAEINRISLDRDFAELLVKSESVGYEALSEIEKVQLQGLSRSVLNVQQGLFYQYLQGSLDEGIWAGRCRQMVRMLKTEEFLDVWRQSGHMFGNDFRDFIGLTAIPGDDESCD